MASVKFSRKVFESFVKITPEIEEKIRLFGTPLERVADDELEIEIFPNRPDLLSLQGYLRSFLAFCGKNTGLRKYAIKKPQDNFKVIVKESVKEIRPFTACAILKDLSFDDEKIKEIIDIQEKLHLTLGRNRKRLAIGIYPLEKIKLPITYEARKPQEIRFIPLEERAEMSAPEILARHSAGKAYAHLLNHIPSYPVFVDANQKILSMPPIINSNETGRITESTKEIFIECSGFDLAVLKKALNILVTTLIDMGGTAYAMEILYAKKEVTPGLSPQKMKLSLEKINSLLGLSLKEKDLEKLLPRMGYEYKKPNVLIPAWRVDVMHEVDIIEDIAISYGYNNIMPELPSISTIGSENKHEKLKRKIAQILVGAGLSEISSYHLVKQEEISYMKEEKIEVENSKTEYKFLRPSLLIPALRIFAENKDNEYPQKIFEIGSVFARNDKEETAVKESTHLLIALTPGNFTHIKQILDYLVRELAVEYSLKEASKDGMIEGRAGSVVINRKEGSIGEIHPEVLRMFNIKQPVSLLELDVSGLIV